MPSKAKKDLFADIFEIGVTMSAANTLTFGSALKWGMALNTNFVIVLKRIEYFPTPTSLRELGAATDAMTIALTNNNSLTTLGIDQPEVYDYLEIVSLGAAVEPVQLPLVHDFSDFDGGGLLLPATDMYLAMDTAGAVAASVCSAKGYYTTRTLSDREMFELIQRLRVLS